MHDVRHALRAWRRTPVLALTAILTIALGVAANTAVFSIAEAVLFRPLPYPAADRLVELFERSPSIADPNQTFRVSALNYLTWATRTKSFDAIAAFQGTAFTITGDSDAERVTGTAVTSSLSRVLGIEPIVGRPLRPEDELPGSAPVALLRHSLWQRRFGGDRSAVGKTITLDGERHEIIGIVPDTFHEIGRSQIGAAADPQVFVPLQIDPARENRANHVLRVAGRMRPGVKVAQAQAEMDAVAAAMAQEFPSTNDGWGVRLVPAQESMLDEGIRPSVLTLLGAVSALMLIACANVSSLVLAKATARQRELALRLALGASRARLARHVLIESLCLAVISGIIGVAVAFVSLDALRSLLPQTLPRIAEVRVDPVVLAFGLATSLGCGVLFGIFPALRISRADPVTALAHGGRAVSGGSQPILRQAIVVAQISLATMLLVGGMLLISSFARLQGVALGFDPGGVVTARVGLPRAAYGDTARIAQFHQRLLESLVADSGVASAAIATSAPFASGVRRGAVIRNWPIAGGASSSVAEHIVSGGYLRTLAIPIVAGRTFDERDRVGSPPVAIVSQSVARQLWPRANPIGQRLERDGQPHEVVGVVGDVRGASDRGARGGGIEGEPRAAIYLAATQFPQRTVTVVLRATANASILGDRLRAAVRAVDPAVPVDQVRTLDEWLADTTANPRLTTTVVAAFAAIALLLAAIGIHGIVAYTVGQRMPEIGLRIAIGATTADVVGLVVRGALLSAAIGMMLGLGAAFLASRILRALLYEVQPDDPVTFAAAATLVLAVSLAACYVPARRVVRVDSMVALRTE